MTLGPLRPTERDEILKEMSDTELVQSCAEAVVRDVTAATSLRIELSRWVDTENGIGAIVHEADTHPTAPVWEALGCLDGGDNPAVHPPSRPTEFFPDSGNRTEVTIDIADAAQHLVQVLLWQRGLDPTWPPCPEHEGRHPLRVIHHPDPTTTRNGQSTTQANSAALGFDRERASLESIQQRPPAEGPCLSRRPRCRPAASFDGRGIGDLVVVQPTGPTQLRHTPQPLLERGRGQAHRGRHSRRGLTAHDPDGRPLPGEARYRSGTPRPVACRGRGVIAAVADQGDAWRSTEHQWLLRRASDGLRLSIG